MTKTIILGGSIVDKVISNSLKLLVIGVFRASKTDIDTSNLDSVRKFVENHNQVDILVLNILGSPY